MIEFFQFYKKMQENMYSYKIILVGDSQVGKSSLVNKFCYNNFSSNLPETVGVGTFVSTMDINRKTVELKIWDTAGQETYSKLLPIFIKGANACILVADLSNSDSIDHILKWHEEVINYNNQTIFLIAFNKSDIIPDVHNFVAPLFERFSSFEKIFLVSAKTGDGVYELFEEVGRSCLSQNVYTYKNQEPVPASGCC